MERARSKPEYYKSKPFLRLSYQRAWSGVGLHIFPTAQYRRGFVSHGCMHLREKDLYEIYNIVMRGKESKTPISILTNSTYSYDHPHPLFEKGYMEVINYGTPKVPQIKLDKYGLVEMGYRKKPIPYSSLSQDATQVAAMKIAPEELEKLDQEGLEELPR